MPDTDFESCPVGTMDAMQQALDILDHNASIRVEPINTYKFREKLRAILKAHRERMGVEMASEVVSRESRHTTQPDYTSETEDLSTWPQTRGKEWRRMGQIERLQKGDVRMTRAGSGYVFVYHTIGSLVGTLDSKEAWTRRPPQTGESWNG